MSQKPRTYLNGWSKGDSVHLVYKNSKGKFIEQITKTSYYFYIRAAEATRIPEEEWLKMKQYGYFEKIDIDQIYPEYYKVFVKRAFKGTDPEKEFGLC